MGVPVENPGPKVAAIGWVRSLVAGALLFAFGVWICLDRGRIGFMPLDQSIVFDGGWRILSGQLPYRDFRTPNGLLPMLLEAGWFRALGVTWLAHCLHAAVFNGFFCVLVYAGCRILAAPSWLAALYGALSGVVFYPPFGVAYADQHAFFFTFVYLLLGLAGARGRAPWDAVAWGATGPIAIAAALSKQIPSALGLPVLLGLLLVSRRPYRAAVAAAAGAALGMGLVIAAFVGWDTPPDRVLNEAVIGLVGQGSARAQVFLDSAALARDMARFDGWRRMPTCWIVPCLSAFLFAVAAVGRWRLGRGDRAKGCEGWVGSPDRAAVAAVGPAAFGLGLFLVGFAFAILTVNQPENALAFLFAALGAVHLGACRLVEGWRDPRMRRVLMAALHIALLGTAVHDAWRFDVEVNQTRLVHDGMRVGPTPTDADRLPAALAFCEVHPIPVNTVTSSDLGDLFRYLDEREGNFFLLGDATVLYGITGRPSVSPVVWFHPGLTIPVPGGPKFPAFERELIAALERHRVRIVIVEGRSTWMRLRLDQFPELLSSIRERTEVSARFGPFSVYEFDRPLGE